MPLAHFGQMMQGSELFTGAALDGVPQAVSDEEVSARPDLYLQGKPFPACCRTILKNVLNQASEMGFGFNLGIETEFFILKETEYGKFVPVSERDTLASPCYDLTGLLDNYSWVTEIVETMNQLGWDVYSFDHEDANGQFETDFAYCDALKMADRFTFFRLMVK